MSEQLSSCINMHKIKNGARISIGSNFSSFNIVVEHHFNWFQKMMLKWCFGFEVEDYDEE